MHILIRVKFWSSLFIFLGSSFCLSAQNEVLDLDYGDNGSVTIQYEEGFPFIQQPKLDASHNLYFNGALRINDDLDYFLARINSDGQLDSLFADNGFQTSDSIYHNFTNGSVYRYILDDRRDLKTIDQLDESLIPSASYEINAVLRAPNLTCTFYQSGDGIITSRFSREILIKLNQGGIDSTFNQNVINSLEAFIEEPQTSSIPDPIVDEEKILISIKDEKYTPGESIPSIVALDHNGNLLRSFGDQGILRFEEEFHVSIAQIKQDLFIYRWTQNFGLTLSKIDNTGNVDVDFGIGGFLPITYDPINGDYIVGDINVLDDGTIVLFIVDDVFPLGEISIQNAKFFMMALSPQGELVEDFGEDGLLPITGIAGSFFGTVLKDEDHNYYLTAFDTKSFVDYKEFSVTKIGNHIFNRLTSSKDLPQEDNSDFKLFPNPSSHQINISNTGRTSKPKQVRLLNLQGQLLKSHNWITFAKGDIFTLTPSGLISGTYIIEVLDVKNEVLYSEKIVLQK